MRSLFACRRNEILNLDKAGWERSGISSLPKGEIIIRSKRCAVCGAGAERDVDAQGGRHQPVKDFSAPCRDRESRDGGLDRFAACGVE